VIEQTLVLLLVLLLHFLLYVVLLVSLDTDGIVNDHQIHHLLLYLKNLKKHQLQQQQKLVKLHQLLQVNVNYHQDGQLLLILKMVQHIILILWVILNGNSLKVKTTIFKDLYFILVNL